MLVQVEGFTDLDLVVEPMRGQQERVAKAQRQGGIAKAQYTLEEALLPQVHSPDWNDEKLVSVHCAPRVGIRCNSRRCLQVYLQ